MNEMLRAAPHVRMHRGKTFVVKVGGGPLQKTATLVRLARQIAAIDALGSRVVIVHGGGPQTDAWLRLLGEEPVMIDGRRVTSPLALKALRLATNGELNGDLTAALLAEGAPAVGLLGASVITARRRPPVVMNGTGRTVDFGEVGDLTGVDAAPLRALLDLGKMPVLGPPALDSAGGFLNVNADLAAAAIAVELHADKLVLVTSAAGVLRDSADPASLVSSLSLRDLAGLDLSGALAGGMKVKATAIAAALEGGVPRVHVVSGLDPEALLVELYTNHGSGTLVTRDPEQAPPLHHASDAPDATEQALEASA